MPFLRIALTAATALGLLLMPVDWLELPMNYPILGNLPEWLFTKLGLVLVVLTIAYAWSESRNIRRWWLFRWLNPEMASSYLRQMFESNGMGDAGAFMDTVASMHDNERFSDTGMTYLISGANDGIIGIRGRLKNGSAVVRVPVPVKDHSDSRAQGRSPSDAQVGADGNIYEDLEFRKSSIKAYVRELRRSAEMDLKEARKRWELEKFIKEHETDPKGDLDKLDALIKRPVRGTGKAVSKASPPASSDD